MHEHISNKPVLDLKILKLKKKLEIAINASLEAGNEILKIYEKDDFNVSLKSDNSPLTTADKNAHNCIVGKLKQTGIYILSEEGKHESFENRKNNTVFWLVDPLDGTKEFIKRNGDFTVNIALIENSKAVAGVIYVPVSKELYFGSLDIGAFKVEGINYKPKQDVRISDLFKKAVKLPLKNTRKKYTVVGSLSHKSEETENFISKLKEKYGQIDNISRGSSLKICMTAEGRADIYPRFAPTMEWDTAAGHAILSSAGGKITLPDLETELQYNKENLLNPYFIAFINNPEI